MVWRYINGRDKRKTDEAYPRYQVNKAKGLEAPLSKDNLFPLHERNNQSLNNAIHIGMLLESL